MAIFLVMAVVSGYANYSLERKLGRSPELWPTLFRYYGLWWSWGLLVPIIYYLSKRFSFSKKHWFVPLAVHIAVSFIWLPISLASIVLYGQMTGVTENWVSQFKAYFGLNLLMDYHWYWVIFLAISAWSYARDAIKHRERFSELSIRHANLQKSLSQAKLERLEAQLKPHFLYNTHNTIAALIREERGASALEVLHLLSQLLRRSLESNLSQLVTLGQELTFVESYLGIQKIRFPDRLRVQMDIEEGCLGAKIPEMILQPLLENAVHHGIVSQVEGDTISLCARHLGGMLKIDIVNTTGPDSSDTAGFGIGLKNTRARLEHLYGTQQALDLEYLDSSRIAARISLPFRTD